MTPKKRAPAWVTEQRAINEAAGFVRKERREMGTVLYRGAEKIITVKHPISGTVHHSKGRAYGDDTFCGIWIADATSEATPVSELVKMIDGCPVPKVKLCDRCWLESWFEEAQ